jgi:rubrerythrin
MSIAMERFASNGLFPTFHPVVAAQPRVDMYYVQCRSCGFEPEATDRAPRTCPKCSGRSWERFTRPGSLLADAERF